MDDLGLPMGVLYAAVAVPLAVFAAWWMGFLGPSRAVAEPAVAPPTTIAAADSVGVSEADDAGVVGESGSTDDDAGASAEGGAVSGTPGRSAVTTTEPATEVVLVDGATSIAGVGRSTVVVESSPVGADTLTLSMPSTAVADARLVVIAADGAREEFESVGGADVVAVVDPAVRLSAVEVEVDGPWALSWTAGRG